MILEVDTFTTLEDLSADIVNAAESHPHNVFNSVTPMKVELDKENFDKVIEKLKSHGSYEGIRNIKDFPSVTWNVSGYYVVFIQKK